MQRNFRCICFELEMGNVAPRIHINHAIESSHLFRHVLFIPSWTRSFIMHLLRIYHILGTKDVWVNAGPSYSQGAVSVFGEKDLCSKGYSAKCSDQYWSSAPGCSGIMEESPNSIQE